MYRIIILSGFLNPFFLFSQNLVVNGSFETFINCPTGNSQLNGNVPPWNNPPGSGTTPDYFNACANPAGGCNDVDVPVNFAGNSLAFDGSGYAGILTYYTACPNCREYIQAPLASMLTGGQSYLVSMRIRLGSQSQYATNNLGLLISSSAVNQPGNQPITGYIPQVNPTQVVSDTSAWTLVSTVYMATGNEQYVTIGNFYDNVNTHIDTLGSSTSPCVLASAAAFYYIDSVTVALVNPGQAPGVSFISSDTTFCDKKCIDFTDLSTNNPTSWQWYFPGAVPSSDTSQNPVNICYNAYGTFDVTLIACNASGCDTLFIPSFITEYQLPPQPVITQSHDTLYCTPTASSYAWYNTLNPGVILSTGSFYTSSNGGSFFVIVGDSLGCQNSSSVFTAASMVEPETYTGATIYFNPSSDQLNVLLPDGTNGREFRLEILDLSGRLVLQTRFEQSPVVLSMSPVGSGMYLVRLTGCQSQHHRKIIIQK